MWYLRRQRKKREEEAWRAGAEPGETEGLGGAGAGQTGPLMQEINDGITAPKGHRYKSIPTRKKLMGESSSDVYDETGSRKSAASSVGGGGVPIGAPINPNLYGPPPVPSKGTGTGSKLRNVVAAQEGVGEMGARRSTEGQAQRKFTLGPEGGQSQSQGRVYRTP